MTHDYRILLVEDEESLHRMLRLNLESEGYTVVSAMDGLEGLEKAQQQAFDLLVLDVMLPGTDGFSLCQTLRLEGNGTPVLFLSAKGSGKDRIEGLKIGGDDYLPKPFDLEELLLRVGKLIRRKEEGSRSILELEEFSFGPNHVDFKGFKIKDRKGVEHELSRKEMMLLRLLVQKEGEVVSREEILEKIWGYDVFPNTRTIDNFLLSFRKYFEEDSRQPIYFQSIRGVGYRFTSGK
jgi:two-component system, OmpR family, alkaline phosphatase synthesis response regulator PhoP